VLMMKPTEDGPRDELTASLDWSMSRRVLAQGQVCSEPVVVGRIGFQEPAQMVFAQDLRTSMETLGLPPRDCDFHCHIQPKAGPVPAQHRVRLDDRDGTPQRVSAGAKIPQRSGRSVRLRRSKSPAADSSLQFAEGGGLRAWSFMGWFDTRFRL